MTAAEFAASLVEKHRAAILAKRSRPWTPSLTPATDLGYECERRIVYHRVRPHDAAGIDAGLASIFEEGDLHQRDVRAKLSEMGAEVLEAERNFRDERLEITGTIDGKVSKPSDEARPRRLPLEIKSTAGAPPVSQEEWAKSEGLLRRYYAQLQIYLVLTSEPEGLALFKEKNTGEWTIVAVALDYEFAEGLLKKAERVRDAVAKYKSGDAAETSLPPRLASRAECRTCPWAHICNPAEAPVDPMLLAVDEELGGELDRRSEVAAPRAEYEKLHEKIKERFSLTKGERFIIAGRWLVEKKKHGKGTRLEISKLELADGATGDFVESVSEQRRVGEQW